MKFIIQIYFTAMTQSKYDRELSIKRIESFILVTQKSIEQLPFENQILTNSCLNSQCHNVRKNSIEGHSQDQRIVQKQRNAIKILTIADKTLKMMKCKAKMLETVQKHSQLKKKYEVLLTTQSEQKTQRSSDLTQKEKGDKNKIQFLTYNEINNNEIIKCSSTIKQNQSTILGTKSMKSFPLIKVGPTILSLYNGGHYQNFYVLKLLGEGISGKVYLVMSLNNRMIYSVKMIKKSSLTSINIKQIIREIKIQSFINHPNIVKLYHFMVDKEFIYLFLEPCLDGDLKQNVKESNGRICQRQVKKIIRQVANSVEYMHQNDIIHRDIRPQNILFHQGNVKICDFGWAIYSPLLRDTHNESQLYSPRKFGKQELNDSKSDIWNIGVLTYQLLFGNIPFMIKNFDNFSKKIEQQMYFPGQINISDLAKQFILGCVHKNPIKRFTIRQIIESEFLNGSDKFRWTIM